MAYLGCVNTTAIFTITTGKTIVYDQLII